MPGFTLTSTSLIVFERVSRSCWCFLLGVSMRLTQFPVHDLNAAHTGQECVLAIGKAVADDVSNQI